MTRSAASGDGGASSRSTPESCRLDDALDEVRVHRGGADQVHDALAVEAEVEEHAVVAELEVAVDQADPPAEAVQRDRGVDGDRGRAHAALRAVVGVDAAHRRAADQRLAGREARDQALHPGEQLGRVERLDQVVVGTGAQRPHLALHVLVGGEHDDRDVAAGRPPRRGSGSRPRSRRSPGP